MVVLSFFITGIFLFVLQETVFMPHVLWPAAPDFYFVLVAYLAYRLDLLRSLLVIFPLAWFYDIFSGTFVGTYPAICLLAYFLLKFVSARIVLRESLYQIPMIGVCYLVVSWILYIMFTIFSEDVPVEWSWPKMLLRASLIVLVAPLLFFLFEKLRKRFEGRFVPFRVLRLRPGNRFRRDEQ